MVREASSVIQLQTPTTATNKSTSQDADVSSIAEQTSKLSVHQRISNINLQNGNVGVSQHNRPAVYVSSFYTQQVSARSSVEHNNSNEESRNVSSTKPPLPAPSIHKSESISSGCQFISGKGTPNNEDNVSLDSGNSDTNRVLKNVQQQLDINRLAAANFINSVLGSEIIPIDTIISSSLPDVDVQAILKDGVIVNDLISKLFPSYAGKAAKKSFSPWVHKENVTAFLAICEKVGVSAESRFESSDLVDGRNMKQVYITLNSLERLVLNTTGISYSKSGSSPAISRKATVDNIFARYSGTNDTSNRVEEILPISTGTASPQTVSSPQTLSRKSSINNSSTNNTYFLSKTESAQSITEDSIGRLNNSYSNGPHLGSLNRTNSVNIRSGRNSVSGMNAGSANGSVSSLIASSAPLTRKATRRKEIINLGRYQLANCIGKGQFGSVYQAFDTETGNVVAIKRIALTKKNKDAVDELMSEVQLLKSLTHPNIVKYLGLTKEDEYLDIVLEYMECGSLLSIMKKYDICIQEPLASSYVRDILQGLEYLHSRGVVHCDLKCANILTTKDSNIKITDFGVSKQLNFHTGGVAGTSGTAKTVMSSSDSNAEAIAGTPYWMAPEVIRLEGVCTASDIWSLGCTVIEMITGKPPYSEMKNPMAVLFRIVEDDEPPIPEHGTISELLHEFLSLCFRQDVANRASASELLLHPWILRQGVISQSQLNYFEGEDDEPENF